MKATLLQTPLGIGTLCGLAFLVAVWLTRPDPDSQPPSQDLEALRAAVAEIQGELALIRQQQQPLARAEAVSQEQVSALAEQIATIEETLALAKVVSSAEEREALFRGEFGYEKADEFLELGQPAIAGNGYLLFLEAYPEHPDARDIMQKARDAFVSAGYSDKARWVQQQVMERYPENLAKDAYKMALMLKQEHRYDEALEYIDQATAAATNDVDRLWRQQYRAFLIQQRDGNAAGAEAYLTLLDEIESANLMDDPLGKNTQERLADLQGRLLNAGP